MTQSTLTIHPDQTFWTDEQLTALQTVVVGKASRADLEQLFHLCKTRNLDVFGKDVYAIARGGRMTLQLSIDALRKIAARVAAERGCLIGNKPPVFYRPDGSQTEFPTPDFVAVKWTATMVGPSGVEVERSSVLSVEEYAQNGGMWKKMKSTMMLKCAEAVSLRALAPEALGGIYSSDEFSANEDKTSSAAPRSSGRKVPVRDAKMQLFRFITETGLEDDQAKHLAMSIWTECGSPTQPLTREAIDAMLEMAHVSVSSLPETVTEEEPFAEVAEPAEEGPYSLDDEVGF